MDITKLDANFLTVRIKEQDIVWKNPLEQPFSLHGIYYDEQENAYRRMPRDIAKQVSVGGRNFICKYRRGKIAL